MSWKGLLKRLKNFINHTNNLRKDNSFHTKVFTSSQLDGILFMLFRLRRWRIYTSYDEVISGRPYSKVIIKLFSLLAVESYPSSTTISSIVVKNLQSSFRKHLMDI